MQRARAGCVGRDPALSPAASLGPGPSLGPCALILGASQIMFICVKIIFIGCSYYWYVLFICHGILSNCLRHAPHHALTGLCRVLDSPGTFEKGHSVLMNLSIFIGFG